MYEAWLMARGVAPDTLESVEAQVTEAVEAAAGEALLSRDRTPQPSQALYEGVSEGGTLIGLEKRPLSSH